jgi:hypothetical protein
MSILRTIRLTRIETAAIIALLFMTLYGVLHHFAHLEFRLYFVIGTFIIAITYNLLARRPLKEKVIRGALILLSEVLLYFTWNLWR